EYRRGQGVPGSPRPRAEAAGVRGGGPPRRGPIRDRHLRFARRSEAEVVCDPVCLRVAAGVRLRPAARNILRRPAWPKNPPAAGRRCGGRGNRRRGWQRVTKRPTLAPRRYARWRNLAAVLIALAGGGSQIAYAPQAGLWP